MICSRYITVSERSLSMFSMEAGGYLGFFSKTFIKMFEGTSVPLSDGMHRTLSPPTATNNILTRALLHEHEIVITALLSS